MPAVRGGARAAEDPRHAPRDRQIEDGRGALARRGRLTDHLRGEGLHLIRENPKSAADTLAVRPSTWIRGTMWVLDLHQIASIEELRVGEDLVGDRIKQACAQRFHLGISTPSCHRRVLEGCGDIQPVDSSKSVVVTQ
jgi:hypothetical protein